MFLCTGTDVKTRKCGNKIFMPQSKTNVYIYSITISGQAAQNDEIKEELEEIISGLQSYLSHVRQKAQKETVDYNRLLRDREELLHTLADLEKDREELRKTEAELSLWKQVKL